MTVMKRVALLCVILSVAVVSAQAGTLEDVKKKGILTCGISEGVPGFSIPDSTGKWVGFDVDMARAVAAAVLNDASKVKYVPLASKQKIVAVSSGQVDLTSRTTTWTLKRDGKQGVDFTRIVFYDGQGFMISKKAGVKSAKELDGASVCVTAGTTTELNLTDFARANGIKVEAVVFDGKKEALNAYATGRCDCFTTDISQLASLRSTIKNAILFLDIQHEFGSFDKYIWQFTGGTTIVNSWTKLDEIPVSTIESDAMSEDLKKRGFKFVGTTICYAFMQAAGMVNDHLVDCYRYKEVGSE